ncbi:TetR family transcriptional regulator [Halopseudomonas oceani]|uniref:TetR/AcrR family transcriptional regulator n=1 Tax=Halopseudomonas oceani TaxID=1708783 RepID=A0A2P4ES47_9GAMM|nr:TetR/AcrR family transcriptional regulator [Halopseudomonas oceani]POB01789.1 TetR/AcrR family transcriptional regulator [Halopseudomonas oceani]GGE54946.1 TetR family transcriptional regulator [Halopseudomonas oceani]
MAKPAKRSRDAYHVGNLAPQLLAAARTLLEEVGPTKLSLRAVSERVGVSATAAYHHFQNRNELISHLAAQGFAELAAALQRAYSSGSGLDKVRGGSLAYLHFARSNPALYQLMFGPEFTDETLIPALQRERLAAFGELKRMVAETLGQALDSSDVRKASVAAWSYIHGLTSLVIHGLLPGAAGNSDEHFVDRTLEGFAALAISCSPPIK